MVSGQSFGSSVVSLACITSMCSVQCFPGGHSLRSALGSFFYPHPSPPFILPLLNQCDGYLVPLAWGLMAGGRGFASHGGATLSRGWLCQGGSPWTSRAPTSTSDAVVNLSLTVRIEKPKMRRSEVGTFLKTLCLVALCLVAKFRRKNQICFCKILRSRRYFRNVLSMRFHLNCNASKFQVFMFISVTK